MSSDTWDAINTLLHQLDRTMTTCLGCGRSDLSSDSQDAIHSLLHQLERTMVTLLYERGLKPCELCGEPLGAETGVQSNKRIHARCSLKNRMKRWRQNLKG